MNSKISGRVLLVLPKHEDYQSLSLLHGLRSILGERVVDFPKYDPAYRDFPLEERSAQYGKGFTLFFDLDPIAINRDEIEKKIADGYFSLVVFCDILNLTDVWTKWKHLLRPSNTVIIDGQDATHVVPHTGFWWRRPREYIKLQNTSRFLYFKREWTQQSRFNIWHRLLPKKILNFIPHSRRLRKIGFSIPKSKIISDMPIKTKDFPTHIVDTEVAHFVRGSTSVYPFIDEEGYYKDLQQSKFGITMKRAGWDCLRHYEIAANGAVPCFRNLKIKPITCAPHGLISGVNCLEYENIQELMSKISHLSDEEYNYLQKGAVDWARSNTTEVRAHEFLRILALEGLAFS